MPSQRHSQLVTVNRRGVPARMSQTLRYVHLALPVIFLLSLALTRRIWPEFYDRLIVEDGPIEWATAAVYIATCAVSVDLARRTVRDGVAWPLYFAFLSLCFLFVALEEISWGQRIFKLDTPEYLKQRNVQSEISLHNLSSIRLLLSSAYIAVGMGGVLGWPALSWLGVPEGVVRRFAPSPMLSLYFAPCAVFYFIAEIMSPLTTVRYLGKPGAVEAVYGGKINDPKGILALPAYLFDLIRDWLPMWSGVGGTRSALWRHQEPFEFLLSLGFLFFLLSCRATQDPKPCATSAASSRGRRECRARRDNDPT